MRDLRITDDSTPTSLDAPDAIPWDDLKRISGPLPGNAAHHDIAGRMDLPFGETGSSSNRDSSARLHAHLAANGHPAHDMAQAANVWPGDRSFSTNGDPLTTSDQNSTGSSTQARMAEFPEGLVFSDSANQGWSISGSTSTASGPSTGQSAQTSAPSSSRSQSRPPGEPQAKRLHIDSDIAFGTVDLAPQQGGASAGRRSDLASPLMGTYFGQDTTTKLNLGPGWTAQPDQYPIAPADDSWNLNGLGDNEWLGFHTQSIPSQGAGGEGEAGPDGMVGLVDTSAAIEEFMRNFEEVTRDGTGYHGPRP